MEKWRSPSKYSLVLGGGGGATLVKAMEPRLYRFLPDGPGHWGLLSWRMFPTESLTHEHFIGCTSVFIYGFICYCRDDPGKPRLLTTAFIGATMSSRKNMDGESLTMAKQSSSASLSIESVPSNLMSMSRLTLTSLLRKGPPLNPDGSVGMPR